eukprot:gnl/Dysnectes_brevis/1149_a1283_2893.p1 GENE.gnl/Dysnectes_brevis/1149_a1283_2893~~gnl/Dysnectes_brevis/1149_a1283_2893.p1  ORF type:complete len:485 (+),score=129.71 gnl/Dysnectes_brevis/1149_a1283_2893:1376-2830(+)
MKLVFALLLILAVANCDTLRNRRHFRNSRSVITDGPRSNRNDLPKEQFFDQQLVDHFARFPNHTGYWSQRYYVNDTSYTGPGAPVLLMIGGEAPETADVISGDYFMINEYAEQMGALIVDIEHRFYGSSWPATLSNEDLQLLNADQAMADIATFWVWFRDTYLDGQDTAVFTVGGSYSGALSGWLRLKYPHLFAGALASSAPVRAEFNFFDYFNVVSDAIPTDECRDHIASGVAKAEQLITTAAGRAQLKTQWHLCNAIKYNDPNDVANVMDTFIDPIAGTCQYAKKGDLDTMCTVIMSEDDGLDGLAAYYEFYYGFDECVDASYDSFVDAMKTMDQTSDWASSRSWFYQTCESYGYYQTGDTSPIASTLITIDYFRSWCIDIYGMDGELVEQMPDYTNTLMGSDKPVGSRVYWANGQVDPWSALGVTRYIGTEMPYRFMEQTSHCHDMYKSSPLDYETLHVTRGQQLNSLQSWFESWKHEHIE